MTNKPSMGDARERSSRPVPGAASIGRLIMLLTGLVVLTLALPPFFRFPWLDFWLVPLAGLYLFLLLVLPRLWLVVLPLVTVGVDLTPFTGRFAYNELDLAFLVTLASGLLYGRYRFRVFSPSPAVMALACYLVVLALGYSGWTFFLLPPEVGWDNPYYTSEYAYKVFKGMVWGVALVPMWGYLLAVDKQRAVTMLVTGLCCASLLLGLIVLWERGTLGVILSGSAWYHVVNSLLDLSSSYRVTGIFSDMHTGGEAYDGVILLLLPASLYATTYGRAIWIRLLGALALLALAYATLVRFSWATYGAVALALTLFGALTLLARHRNNIPLPVPLAAVAAALGAGLVAAIFAFTLGGSQINERAPRVSGDPDTPDDHWRDVVESAQDGFFSGLLGNGVGRFPASYIGRHPTTLKTVGSFRVTRQANRDVLRMEGGQDLMLGQRVTMAPDIDYTVTVHVRAENEGRVVIGLCERNMIYASNSRANCLQNELIIPRTEGVFAPQTLEINSGRIGEYRALWRWPTIMTIKYDTPDTMVEIDAIELSADGFNFLRNSSFKQGLDYWFPYNDAPHLPWHIKNTFLQVWFESGWLGLGLFLALLVLLVHTNLERHAPDSLVPVYTTGVLTVCLFGLFGSPLDSARVSWLFYFFLAAGLAGLRVRSKVNPYSSGPGRPRLESAPAVRNFYNRGFRGCIQRFARTPSNIKYSIISIS